MEYDWDTHIALAFIRYMDTKVMVKYEPQWIAPEARISRERCANYLRATHPNTELGRI